MPRRRNARRPPLDNSQPGRIIGTVALPESRQLDVLANLLERRDVRVVRCPLVAILDSPHADAIEAWLRRFIATPPELFVVYTGEGIYRLMAAAERLGLQSSFTEALYATPILTRGPKPVRALKSYGIVPEHAAAAPTTEGMIESLKSFELNSRRLCIQYYGADANEQMATYLDVVGADVDAVMPYVYASKSDEQAVLNLIDGLCGGDIDAVAFTSQSQVDRLFTVARRAQLDESLRAALQSRMVAAIGPVAANALREAGCSVDVMPESSFFMKPLVTRLVAELSRT